MSPRSTSTRSASRKLLVIGVDALDHDYVVTHRIIQMCLKRYGKVPIPKELFYNGEPYTPLVWTAYLTGRDPREVGVKSVYEMPLIFRLLKKVVRFTPLRFVGGKSAFLRRLGIDVVKPYRIKGRTLFDVVDDSVPISVPGVNLDSRFYTILEMIARGQLSDAVRVAFRMAEDVFVKAARIIMFREPRLVFPYVNVLDIVGHVYWVKEPWRVKKAYLFVADWVSRLRRLSERHGYDLIIISDHGMRDSGDGVTGTHTDYGFWASTIHDFSISSPYEFFSKVVSIMC